MPSERFTFRPLRASDKDAVLAISAKVWDGDDYLPSSFDSWVDDGEGIFNGCFVGDKLVGCGRVGFVAPGHAWLEGLRKDLDSGVSGVGRALCLEGLRYLSGVPGLRSIRFSTYVQSAQSIALNEAIGFRRVGTYTIKSKRLPGEPSPGEDAGGYVARAATDREAAFRRLESSYPFDGFRIESWKAYPLPDSAALRPDDVLIEVSSPARPSAASVLGSLDPLKAQGNVVAFFAEDQRAAKVAFLAFEEAVRSAGYSYIEAVVPRSGSLLATLDACGYASWETEDDFLLYEWPTDRLGRLSEVAAG
ncbi:MAG: hypothetical protein CVV47_06365 [Spirochaetae bacterium HGW-Spirochaetae-3]|jgi:RimJ/RimL family protein N-acetyltransferase|nr:MAG: hypothetical protein CVV47_06365 [Spirochaetae bacterium HGW-Spirochaetae-3]